MDSHEALTQEGSPRRLWPARSRARVLFYQGERTDVRRIARRLFGRNLQTWEYASLVGAPDDARTQVGTYNGGLYVEMFQPSANAYRGVWLVGQAPAGPVVVNDGFQIYAKSMQRKGLGLLIFCRQLEQAEALGVSRIETTAGRAADENGYYTWPRFGFGGPLPQRIRQNLPLGLEHAQDVMDVMECEKGRLWWREHGETIDVAFDLTEDGRSQEVFRRYLRSRLGHDAVADLEQTGPSPRPPHVP